MTYAIVLLLLCFFYSSSTPHHTAQEKNSMVRDSYQVTQTNLHRIHVVPSRNVQLPRADNQQQLSSKIKMKKIVLEKSSNYDGEIHMSYIWSQCAPKDLLRTWKKPQSRFGPVTEFRAKLDLSIQSVHSSDNRSQQFGHTMSCCRYSTQYRTNSS